MKPSLGYHDRAKSTSAINNSNHKNDESSDGNNVDELSIVTDFGSNRQLWEERGKLNTPTGLDPDKFSPKLKKTAVKPKTVLRNRSTSQIVNPRSDIFAKRKSFVGNAKLLKSHSTGGAKGGLDPSNRLKDFPHPISDKIVTKILEKVQEINGGLPKCITFTLWGTDNVNVYAKTMGQIFLLLGAKFVDDSSEDIELIPLETLGRPRIDVIASCSGSFRDLHMNQMILLDKVIKMVAEADEPEEMNLVRKHALEQANEFNIPVREAATRVYSNAAGVYSSNVAELIKSNDWRNEGQLQKEFIERKGHAFDFERPDTMEYRGDLFKEVLKKCDVTVQNVDLSEIISVTDVPHYYDSDPTKVIQELRDDKKKPLSLWANALKNKDREVLTLAETLRLDTLKKILSPDYYEKILATPEGVRGISKCLRNVFGWAVTAGEVDTFVFEISYNVFIEDKKMLNRLRQNDRDAYQTLITTFLKANEHGYWVTGSQNPMNLRRLLVDEWRHSGALSTSRQGGLSSSRHGELLSGNHGGLSSSNHGMKSRNYGEKIVSSPLKRPMGVLGSWRQRRKTSSDRDMSLSSHGELSTIPTWRRGFVSPTKQTILSRSGHG